jgi:predicted outer membrane repeat protein
MKMNSKVKFLLTFALILTFLLIVSNGVSAAEINNSTNSLTNSNDNVLISDNTNVNQISTDTVQNNTERSIMSNTNNVINSNVSNVETQTNNIGEANNLPSSNYVSNSGNLKGVVDSSTIYISPTGSPDTAGTIDDPTNWETAFNNINDNGNIYFTTGTYTDFYSQLIIKNINLISVENATPILNANYKGPFFILLNANLSINGLTFINGVDGILINGGAINVPSGNLTLNNTYFINNMIDNLGGAIFIDDGNLIVNNSYFTQNSAQQGGAIYYTPKSNVNIRNSTFDNNVAFDGGAIYGENGNLTIDNSTFITNAATIGGAIFADGSDILIKNNTNFINNLAIDSLGGGTILITSNANVTINQSNFVNNTAYTGGAILLLNGTLTTTGSTFINNTANLYGGAICDASGNNMNILDSTFTENNATNSAGAIYSENGNLTINGSNFSNNNAEYGAVITVLNSTANINNSNFVYNNATGYGAGAIFITNNANVTVDKSNFVNNTAYTGGAILVANGTLITTGSTFINNTAILFGGAICDPAVQDMIPSGNNINVTGSVFLNNTANGNLNAIYYTDNLNASYNWWGNNTPFNGDSYNKLIEHNLNDGTSTEYISADNWVIMGLSANPNPVDLGKNATLTVTLNQINTTNGVVSALPDGVVLPNRTVTFDGDNGVFNPVSSNISGEITSVYTPNATGNVSATIDNMTLTIPVNVSKNIGTVLTANQFNQTQGAGMNFTGKLVDVNGNPLVGQHIALNLTRLNNGANKVYWVTTDVNGEYQLEINLCANEYTIKASFEGQGLYLPSESNLTNVTVNKIPTTLTANTFKAVINAGKNFTGKLVDVYGKPVANQIISLNLTRLNNGATKVYWVTTDANGEYQLPIRLAAYEYTIKAVFTGTHTYLPSEASLTSVIVTAK